MNYPVGLLNSGIEDIFSVVGLLISVVEDIFYVAGLADSVVDIKNIGFDILSIEADVFRVMLDF
ncbi:MAG: hypothetical protein LBD35_04460 [Prevotellaceae bacterium]|jgi:hypothetical protein|nr:hypothetical protein [Prevotellaceae bacterium]